MKVRILLVLMLVLAVPALLAAGGDAEAGKALFKKKCRVCHGADGAGNPQIAKMLKVELKPLGGADVQGQKDPALAKIIKGGTGKMKPVKKLSDGDIANIIAFVRTLKK